MRKLKVLIIAFLIFLSICAFASMQAKAQPTVSLSPTSWTMDVGQTETFTASVSGASGTLSYQWYVDSVLQSGQVTSTFSYSPSSSGSYSIYVTANDSADGLSGSSNVVTVTVNSALVAPTVTATPTTVNQGQTSSLSSTAVSTGTSPYMYVWFQEDPGASSYSAISGATSSSYSFVTTGSTTAGVWSFELQVIDSASSPFMVTSAAVSVTVNVALTVSVSPGTATLDAGQSKTFTATPSGGSGSYTSYQWYVGGVAQTGQTASTFSFAPASSGSYSITVTVTDSLGATSAQSAAATVTVNSVLVAPTASASAGTIDQSQTSALSSTAVTTGTSPYTYQWLQKAPGASSYSAISSATSSSYSFATTGSTTTGAWSFELQVTDAASAVVTSNSVSITVNSALSISISPTSVTLNVGQSQTFSATASGGSGSYSSYQWYVNGVAQSGQTASTFSYSPAASGSYSITVTVTDSLGATSAQSTAATVAVNIVLSVTVSPTSWAMDVGQSKTFTATPAGGSGSYTGYQWYVDSALQIGEATSTFSYSPVSSGSYSITVTVTDSLDTTSAQSTAATVTVSASPTVSITPTGPVTMDAGQVQTFTAAASGGSGTLSYQWYLDGVAVGSKSVSYSYTASGTSHSVTCKVTDSASTPVTSPASNAVSVAVNSALVAPTVTPTLGTVNQGQTSSLTSSSVTTGTSPYTYQWLEKAPGGSYVMVGSNSASFSFATSNATATGYWSFILQVKDNAGASVNSSAVSVTVNSAPLDYFAFSSVGAQTAGTPFSVTVTAKDAYGNTITSYTGINTLSVSSGTISPTSTGVFSRGVWTGSVTVTGAGSGVTLFTSGSGVSGTSGSFTVNPGVLAYFTFSNISSPQIAYFTFSVTVTAEDAYGNTVTGYTGTPSLTYSAGSISPDVMNPFVSGVGSTTIKVTAAGLGVTITATDGTHAGTSNSFTVNPLISATAGANGAISPSGTFSVNYGSDQSFTITPNIGYYIADVTVNGASVGAVSSYTLTNVQASYSVFAAFALTPPPTSTTTTTPAPTPPPSQTPTPIPKATPTPKTASSPTSTPAATQSLPQHPLALLKQTQSQSLSQEGIYEVAAAVIIATVLVFVLLFDKKRKVEGNPNQEVNLLD